MNKKERENTFRDMEGNHRSIPGGGNREIKLIRVSTTTVQSEEDEHGPLDGTGGGCKVFLDSSRMYNMRDEAGVGNLRTPSQKSLTDG